LWRAVGFVARMALFAEVAVAHDVFIFGFGQTFFRGLDLRILRLLGRKVILVFNGSDHRPPYLNGVFCRTPEEAASPQLRDETARVKRRVTLLEAHANLVVAHHLSAQFHEKPYVPFMVVGIPSDIPELGSPAPPVDGGAVRVLHAPSNPAVKGSDLIRAAIARLKDRGHSIVYEEIVGRPNAEVLGALRRCDLVVDELYSDARMAGLASEAATLAKPVIVAGYASDAILRIPGVLEIDDFPPVLYCRPEEIEAAIENLVQHPEAREELGGKARRYVERHWRPESVAARLLAMIRQDGAALPVVDPKDLRYFHGFGLEEGALSALLRIYLDVWGVEALHLHDKPALESAVRRFCSNHSESARTTTPPPSRPHSAPA
jgi:glycosyltransferase involved in cell wall biosynthesis